MSNPIDVIANAIRIADGNHTMGAGQLAEVAARALTDDHIVSNAHAALLAEQWDDDISGDHLLRIAETVLRSVGGA